MKLWIGDEAYPQADDWDIQELRMLKRETGLDLGAFSKAVQAGDPDALCALVWVAKRRTQPGLALDDVHFKPSDLRFEGEDGDDPKAQTGTTSGSPSSPSISDGPETSTTA